jgi:hypothetical protein
MGKIQHHDEDKPGNVKKAHTSLTTRSFTCSYGKNAKIIKQHKNATNPTFKKNRLHNVVSYPVYVENL